MRTRTLLVAVLVGVVLLAITADPTSSASPADPFDTLHAIGGPATVQVVQLPPADVFDGIIDGHRATHPPH